MTDEQALSIPVSTLTDIAQKQGQALTAIAGLGSRFDDLKKHMDEKFATKAELVACEARLWGSIMPKLRRRISPKMITAIGGAIGVILTAGAVFLI